MQITRIAGNVPMIIAIASESKVICAVEIKQWRSSLGGENSVQMPTRQHLSIPRSRRQVVSAGKGKAVTNIGIGIRPFESRIETVLNIKLAIASRVVNRVRPGVACYEIQPFGGLLPKGHLQAMIDRVILISQLVDVAQHREFTQEGPSRLSVVVVRNVDCVVVLVNIANAVEFVAFIAHIAHGQRSIVP